MYKFNTTEILGLYVSIEKFDNDKICQKVLSNPAAVSAIAGDVGIIYICRDDLKDYKNDSWISKGTTYHTIIVPHDEVVAKSTDEVTELCVELTVERLLQWAEKKRKKPVRARTTARV
jgi:hypothetical protein